MSEIAPPNLVSDLDWDTFRIVLALITGVSALVLVVFGSSWLCDHFRQYRPGQSDAEARRYEDEHFGRDK